MSGLGALFYADARTIVNAFHDIRRNAARSTLWIGGALLFLLWLVVRSNAARHPRPGIGALTQCDLVAALAIVTFGVFLAHGSRFVGLFAHRAEAQWIIRSPIAPFAATVYLQLRELIRRSPRLVITFGYLAIVYLPNVVSPAALWRDFVFFALALLAIGAVPLPRRLARGPVAAACIAAGYACVAFALVALVHDATLAFGFGGVLADPVRALPAWHPGSVLLDSPGPRSVAVGVFLASIAVVAITALGVAAKDAYPELYALSSEQIDRAARIGMRGGLFARRPKRLRIRATTGDLRRVPPGAGVFVWKAWVEYVSRTSPRIALAQAAGLFAAGFVLGKLVGHGRTQFWFEFTGIAFTVLLVSTVGFGVSLGHELRRPLFWLSGETLLARLWGLLAGSVWRFCLAFALAGAGIAAARASPNAVALLALDGPAVLVLLGAIGYAAYAVVPHEIDRRGPFAVLRILVSYALVFPAALAGIMAGIIAHADLVGIATAAAASLVEAAALLAFTARRLDTAAMPRQVRVTPSNEALADSSGQPPRNVGAR